MSTMRSRLAAGELLVGPAVLSASPAVVETIGAAGFDWVMLDVEHGATGIDLDLEHLIRAADACGLPALVRVPEPDPTGISKALDMGAAGVVVPRITSRPQVAACVAAAKYPPLGARGMCRNVRASRRGVGWSLYKSSANDTTMLIPMIERRAALDCLEDLASVPGVDGFCFGPGDYGLEAGVEPTDPELENASRSVIEACIRHGLIGMTIAWEARQIWQLGLAGYRAILLATDVAMLASALGSAQLELEETRRFLAAELTQ
jgi:4-hydroxy-2-oxoheptanedioate aldolase